MLYESDFPALAERRADVLLRRAFPLGLEGGGIPLEATLDAVGDVGQEDGFTHGPGVVEVATGRRPALASVEPFLVEARRLRQRAFGFREVLELLLGQQFGAAKASQQHPLGADEQVVVASSLEAEFLQN